MGDWTQLLRSAAIIQAEFAESGPRATTPTVRYTPAVLDDVQYDPYQLFDALITDSDLARWTRKLFRDGHFTRAVEEAFKCLNNIVKNRSRSSADGASLMQHAFSVENPLLKLNRLKSQSDKDEQRGYMELFAGAMRGIRNPRAHNHELEDHPEVALELLVIANHLIVRAKLATPARQGHRRKGP